MTIPLTDDDISIAYFSFAQLFTPKYALQKTAEEYGVTEAEVRKICGLPEPRKRKPEWKKPPGRPRARGER